MSAPPPTTSLAGASASAAPTSATATTATADPIVSDSTPKHVVPAEVAQTPASALDPIASGNTFFDKARETIMPMVGKAQAAAKPYTDAAAAKANELAEQLEGTSASGVSTTSKEPGAPGVASITGTTGTAAPTAGDVGEKAKGMFTQVSSAVQSTFTQLTQSIEQKTSTPTHPGFITQVQNAVTKGQEKLDAFLDQPGKGEGHPVQTTTNTVPHPTATEPTAPATAAAAAAAAAPPAAAQ